MKHEEIVAIVTEIVNGVLEQSGFEVFDLALKFKNGVLTVELLIDKAHGGITLEECIRINKDLVRLFDANEELNEDLAVEVSSPGLDRPMIAPKDFLRVMGAEVDVYLKEKYDERLQYTGKTLNVDAEFLWLDIKGMEKKIPISMINKAMQIIA